MKRALAERAKQSALPNGVGVPSSAMQEKSLTVVAQTSNGTVSPATAPASVSKSSDAASATPQQPVVPKPQVSLTSKTPQKISKVQIKKPSSTTASKTKTTRAIRSPRNNSPVSSPRPKKRARESSVKLEEEDEDDSNAASFYLRHQNRALASELRSVKYQLTRLEREREHRRSKCLQAAQSLNAIYVKWGKIEAVLRSQKDSKTSGNDNSIKVDIPLSDAPLSTGLGKSVEWTSAIMNSLTRIGTGGTTNNDNIKQESETIDSDAMDVDAKELTDEDHEEASEDKKCVNDMLDLAESMSERFFLLQSWISSLLQNIDKSNVPLNGQLNGVIWTPPSASELQNQVARVEAENITLQELVTELTRSRDEMVESDRRVRRGLYRLAAGRVKLKEVLKAVANADEDKESAAAWIEGSTTIGDVGSGSQLTTSSKGTENVKQEKNDDKAPISSKEIDQLKKKISDLDVIASSRDEQIKKVRHFILYFVIC